MTALRESGQTPPDMIELVGGALCLDFANTVEGREGDERKDAVPVPADLILWAERAGVLPEDETQALVQRLASDPAALERSFREVAELREAIYRVFTAIVRGSAPVANDLEVVQRTHAEGMRHARLLPSSTDLRGSYTWQWTLGQDPTLDLLRWRVAQSAVDLLRSGRLDRLRQCPGGGEGPCNWLFVDTTRGGNRRWCSMSDCGSRSKWRRQNAKRRKTRF